MVIQTTRKQVYELTREDFRNCQIWEFCSSEEGINNQDEATVKPFVIKEVLDFSPGAFVVAADTTFADGSSGEGYLYSGSSEDYGCIQPNILLPDGQVNLWLGSLRFFPDWKAHISGLLERLQDISHPFPCCFVTRANVNGEPLHVGVPGFMARDHAGHIITLDRT